MHEDESDDALVARTRQGDPAAFDALVRRHYRAGFAVALAVLGHREDAEDICQDAWLRALERIEDCRRPDRFVFWFLQIVRNRARNRLDHRRVRAADPLEAHEAQGASDPRQDPGSAGLRARLENALADLSETQRSVVLLHDLEGWDHRSIAETLQCSEIMSRQHLFQARRRLRERLGKETGELNHDFGS